MKIDEKNLTKTLKEQCPEIVFAFLHGSACTGLADKQSDIDIAVFLDSKESLDFYKKIYPLLEEFSEGRDIDVGILNDADPVYRFEAIKGRRLLCRDKSRFADFFSNTCREYEYQMADYQRQKKYRKEFSERLRNL
jgi:hypothetical protein